jgi:hypothetical protein
MLATPLSYSSAPRRNRRPSWVRIAAVAALVAWTGVPASAQAKTDVVVLANGDRITGEIVRMLRGRLELKTDDAGTIEIEWDYVGAVTSTREFEVGMSDGRLFLGRLARAAPQQMTVDGVNGGTVAMTDVTNIAAIGRSFWTKLEGSVDAGFSYTKSSGIAQANFNGDVRFRKPAALVRFTAAGTLTYEDGQERDDRAATEFSYARDRGGEWFIAGATRFESNASLGLELRSQISGAAGRRLVNSNRAQVLLGAGIVGNDERGVDAEPTQNLESVFTFTSSYYSYDRPKTNVDLSAQYYLSLTKWGRQRVQVDNSFKRELWKDFFVALSVYVTFDSAPPNPSAEQTDAGTAISAGWSF